MGLPHTEKQEPMMGKCSKCERQYNLRSGGYENGMICSGCLTPDTQDTVRSRFMKIGEGSVRFIATREEVLSFIETEVARAREEGYAQGISGLKLLDTSRYDEITRIATKEERSRILSLLEKRKIGIVGKAKGYDGDNLRSASDHYHIAAENWAEIIRFEDGYNQALVDLSTDIESN